MTGKKTTKQEKPLPGFFDDRDIGKGIVLDSPAKVKTGGKSTGGKSTGGKKK